MSAKPSFPIRLHPGDQYRPIRAAAPGFFAECDVRGAHLRQHLNIQVSAIRSQVFPYSLLRKDIRIRSQAISPVGKGIDRETLFPKPFHRFPDRCPRDAEFLSQLLTGLINALMEFKSRKDPVTCFHHFHLLSIRDYIPALTDCKQISSARFTIGTDQCQPT